MKRVVLASVLLMLTGCGEVEWFPQQSQQSGTTTNATAPEAFTFPPATVPVASAQEPSMSGAATIKGNNSSGWTLTWTDSPATASSDVMINDKYYLKGAGDIPKLMPNDVLRIVQTPSLTIGDVITTTVTVGTYTTQFTTTTTQ
jgi:hypothetical protein